MQNNMRQSKPVRKLSHFHLSHTSVSVCSNFIHLDYPRFSIIPSMPSDFVILIADVKNPPHRDCFILLNSVGIYTG